jgi:flagellar hook assembly protein FlgD
MALRTQESSDSVRSRSPMTCHTRLFVLVAGVAVIAPGPAAAADVRVMTRDVPLAAARASVVRQAPASFTMVGIHWQGAGQVWFRTASRPGQFGSWRPARPEGEDRPDPGSPEGDERAGWKVGNPWWTGRARFIQYRVSGPVTRLRTFFLDSSVTEADRTQAAAPRLAAASLAAEAGPVDRPSMVRRPEWRADESIVRGAPSIAERLRFAVVHHTAGSNSYSAAQSAAIVRGIQRYHVLSNGWDDIGYNFLVDKYGRIFEGRGGGITRNVIGAHAGGFNTSSVGVAVIGMYSSASLPSAARRALQRLLAWRLDVGHVRPTGRWYAVSAGSSRWDAGTRVRLRAVSGHRDTSLTSCPGSSIYGQLGGIARRVEAIGLPKLWKPEATGSVGGLVRFTGRLSSSRAWRVEVKDATGAVVAAGSGTGRTVDWTWNATAVPILRYTYTISAGNVRPSTLPVPGPPPLAITGLRARPRAVTPNGDWSGESTAIRFRLTRRAELGARVVSESSGTLVRTLLASSVRSAGVRSLRWDGRSSGGSLVADGRYRVEISAEDGPEQVTRSVRVVVDRTLGRVSALPAAFSPNGDGRAERLEIGYALTRSASVRVQIRRNGDVVRTLLSAAQGAGTYGLRWSGWLGNGHRLSNGKATVVVLARTSLGRRKLTRPVVLDRRAPVVRVRSLQTRNGTTRVRLTLSESARLRIWFGRSGWRGGYVTEVTRPAGIVTVRRPVRARVVRVVATDAALNRSRAVVYRR